MTRKEMKEIIKEEIQDVVVLGYTDWERISVDDFRGDIEEATREEIYKLDDKYNEENGNLSIRFYEKFAVESYFYSHLMAETVTAIYVFIESSTNVVEFQDGDDK